MASIREVTLARLNSYYKIYVEQMMSIAAGTCGRATVQAHFGSLESFREAACNDVFGHGWNPNNGNFGPLPVIPPQLTNQSVLHIGVF